MEPIMEKSYKISCGNGDEITISISGTEIIICQRNVDRASRELIRMNKQEVRLVTDALEDLDNDLIAAE